MWPLLQTLLGCNFPGWCIQALTFLPEIVQYKSLRWTKSLLVPTSQYYMGSPSLLCCSVLGIPGWTQKPHASTGQQLGSLTFPPPSQPCCAVLCCASWLAHSVSSVSSPCSLLTLFQICYISAGFSSRMFCSLATSLVRYWEQGDRTSLDCSHLFPCF